MRLQVLGGGQDTTNVADITLVKNSGDLMVLIGCFLMGVSLFLPWVARGKHGFSLFRVFKEFGRIGLPYVMFILPALALLLGLIAKNNKSGRLRLSSNLFAVFA